MADRQANINVNYNINTQQVAAAAQQVKNAQTATDQWNKAINQTGTAYKQTSQQFLSNGQRINTTIDGQKVQMQQLRAQIELTRQSDTKRMAQLTADYKILKTNVDAFNKSLQTQQQQTQTLTQSFGGLVTGVRAFIAAGLVKEVVETQLEMAKLAGRFEGVERAFKRLPQSTLLLEDLRKATHGTVTDLGLMQQALRANNFEIDLRQLGKLLEFAATRAQQTGQEVDYLVNSIVMGIGMKSILRLDNLGLSATKLKEELGGVSVKAASVAEITRVVAKVAEESQEKLGNYFETSATKVDQLRVAWEDLKLSFAQGLGGSGLSEIFTGAIEGLKDVTEAFFKSGGSVQAFLFWMDQIALQRGVTEDAIKRAKTIQDEENGSLQQRADFIQQEINTLQELIGKRNDAIASLKEQKKILDEETKTVTRDRVPALMREIEIINQQLEAQSRNNLVQRETQELLKERLKAINLEIEGLNDTGKQLGIVEDLMDRIEAKEDLIKTARSVDEIRKLQREVSALEKELDLVLGKYNDFGKLKLGADKNIPGTQITKLGLEASEITIPTKTWKETLAEINRRFQGVKVPIELEPEFDWESIFNGADFTNEMFDAAQAIEGELIKATLFAEVDAYNQRIEAAEAFYDRQVELAGEKYSEETEAERQRNKELEQIEKQREKSVDALRKRQAEKEIKARRISVIIDTAAGIARAFATSSNIYQAVIQAAIVAAYGASQLAIINKQKANFADGVINLKGPGTERSDSIPANLSKGESVMTAKETRNSMGILKAIRAKKLDDRILEQIKSGQTGGSQFMFDDQRIVRAIERQKYPDVVEQSGTVFKVYEKGRNYRLKVRAKNMGNG